RDIERYAHLCYGGTIAPELLDAVRRTDGRLRQNFSRSMMRGEGADQKRTVEEARIPIAVVNGELDPFIRASHFGSLHVPHLWGGEIVVMRGAGHAAFRDQPERFNALLQRFAADAELHRPPIVAYARRA